MKVLKIMVNDVVESALFGFMVLMTCLLAAGFVVGAMAGQVIAIMAGVPLPWWLHSIGAAGWLVALCLWWLSAKERSQ